MNPIRSLEEVIEHWDIFERGWKAVYAFFLYTNEDKNIAHYVREYFHEIDSLSGRDYLIFLIDKPPKTWEEEARTREYWREFEFKTWIWDGFKEVMPYDRSKAYKIADFLGLPPNYIPCIIFFRNINERDLLMYPLDNSWSDERLTKELRELFSSVRKETKNIDDEETRKEQIWKDLESFIRRKNRERRISQIIMHPYVRSVGDLFRDILFRLL